MCWVDASCCEQSKYRTLLILIFFSLGQCIQFCVDCSYEIQLSFQIWQQTNFSLLHARRKINSMLVAFIAEQEKTKSIADSPFSNKNLREWKFRVILDLTVIRSTSISNFWEELLSSVASLTRILTLLFMEVLCLHFCSNYRLEYLQVP